MALLVGWLLPRTTARRLAHVGLLKALVVQIFSVLTVFLLIDGLIAWALGRPPLDVLREIIREAQRHPEIFMVLVIAFGIFELFLLALAVALLPWGARDEKARSSLYHAVRTLWLQTPQIAVAFGLVITCGMIWQRIRRHFFVDVDAIMYATMLLLVAWCVWGVLRALNFRPVKRREDSMLICQSCGYNLSGTPADGRCSECGEPAADSIAAETRPGTMWQRRTKGWLMPWVRCSVQSILHPCRLGRELQVYRPVDDSWKMLLGHAVASAILCAGMVGLWLASPALGYSKSFDYEFWISMVIATIAGTLYWTAISIMLSASVAALLVGLWFAWTQGCTVMLAAGRVVCHLAGFQALWCIYLYLSYFAVNLAPRVRWTLKLGKWNMDFEIIVIVFTLVLNLVWVWLNFRLIYMAVREARFATR